MSELHRHLEVRTDAATLYLAGVLRPGDAWALWHHCTSLPASARRLRVDMRGLVALEYDALVDIRTMLCNWCAVRGPGHSVHATDGFSAPCDAATVWVPDEGPLMVLQFARRWATAVSSS